MQYPAQMKVLKVILLVVGAIALIVGAVMLFMALMVDLKVIWEIATRYQGGGTTAGLHDPRGNILLISGIALGAGLLLGIGIGLPAQRGLTDKKIDQLVEARVAGRLASPSAGPGTATHTDPA